MKDEEKVREYRLTGRFLAIVLGVVLCSGAVIYLHFFPTTSWIGIFGWERWSGLTLAQRDEVLQYVCGAAAVLIVAAKLASPWITRRIVVTSDHVTIFEARIFGGSPSVIPLSEIRGVTRRVGQSLARHDNALTRRLRESIQFGYGGLKFSFCNAQFCSNAEFEDFCTRLAAPRQTNLG